MLSYNISTNSASGYFSQQNVIAVEFIFGHFSSPSSALSAQNLFDLSVNGRASIPLGSTFISALMIMSHFIPHRQKLHPRFPNCHTPHKQISDSTPQDSCSMYNNCRGVGIGKQVGSMDEESQVRGCYNITFICTPTNLETV